MSLGPKEFSCWREVKAGNRSNFRIPNSQYPNTSGRSSGIPETVPALLSLQLTILSSSESRRQSARMYAQEMDGPCSKTTCPKDTYTVAYTKPLRMLFQKYQTFTANPSSRTVPKINILSYFNIRLVT